MIGWGSAGPDAGLAEFGAGFFGVWRWYVGSVETYGGTALAYGEGRADV